MDRRQLLIDWEKRDRDLGVLRDHCLACGLQWSDAALLVAIAGLDSTRTDESVCRKSKRELAVAAKIGDTTVLRALARRPRLG